MFSKEKMVGAKVWEEGYKDTCWRGGERIEIGLTEESMNGVGRVTQSTFSIVGEACLSVSLPN